MKELWKNARAKAGITLGLWMIFIVTVFVLALSAGSPKDNTQKSQKELNADTISEQFNNILKNTLSYKITYEKKDLSSKKTIDVTYNNDEYTGYLEDSSGITKFRCDKEVCYKVNMGYEEEVPDYIFSDELDLLTFKKVISDLRCKKDSCTYTDENDLVYTIFIKDAKIIKITYDNDDYTTTFDINYNQ